MRAVIAMQDRTPGLIIHTIPVLFPTTHSAFLAEFHSSLRSIPRHPGQKVSVLIDAIASLPGVVLPWEEMVRVCREEGAWSVVDGAHQLGQVPLDLHGVDPDFWTANAHKWLLSKRASGVMYVPKRNQHLIQISLPISSGYVSPHDEHPAAVGAARFTKLFEYTGTIDYVPLLSIGPALDFLASLGGEVRINAYCHTLALQGGALVAEILGTSLLDPTGEWTANMTNVLLPLSLPELGAKEAHALVYRLAEELADERDVMVNVFGHGGRWWVRMCAQVWNEMSDFEKAGWALKDLCARLNAQETGAPAAPGAPAAELEEEVRQISVKA
ncbi:PLP-dependent transferase [Calocera viscosa TUFC12733]|uniref:PLP-dependent transferase n=1 Tax=Calocera viscosa (strain TUFC12733) TaxID=1330018 RepID=A0A167RXL3_CALVF|nr:PLP-dependent transferase [Calocera viscosa TUFC12733]